ncbi:MAG: hypothetical protein GY774_37210 [Planctomycetes bacterium]|nr:hypothetical protein [Planctomycetota bacterium]
MDNPELIGDAHLDGAGQSAVPPSANSENQLSSTDNEALNVKEAAEAAKKAKGKKRKPPPKKKVAPKPLSAGQIRTLMDRLAANLDALEHDGEADEEEDEEEETTPDPSAKKQRTQPSGDPPRPVSRPRQRGLPQIYQ